MDASFSRSTDADHLRAALLFEKDRFRDALLEAVGEAGAELVAEIKLSELQEGMIESLHADALVVNLEPVLDRKPELLNLILNEQSGRQLVFNDAAASERLDGLDRVRWARHLAGKISGADGDLPPRPEPAQPEPASRDLSSVWILGASIGGPEAVRSFLSELPGDLSAAFILAQHIGSEFLDLMASQLDQASELSVRCAREGDRLEPGTVLIVPVDRRFNLDENHRVVLGESLESLTYSPCIDHVMTDMSNRFNGQVRVIIFSGMASDGIAGAEYVINHGGEVWVQNPDTCVVSSMVDGALANGGVSFTGNPAELATRLTEFCRNEQTQ
ncbi:MAG: chemotaxis protein CheB [Xanthomonadales bacterium]|nr:chemotaxis protein CheB [Xanthomonadales bacterium]